MWDLWALADCGEKTNTENISAEKIENEEWINFERSPKAIISLINIVGKSQIDPK